MSATGSGPRDARVVVVGEAWGKDEDRQKAPFVGWSGSLLRENLAKNGIMPSQVYFTNVVNARPPNNEVNKWFKNVKKRVPKEEIARGLATLYRDLAEINPHIVVPVGNVALWALRGHEKITKWRGSLVCAKLDAVRLSHAVPYMGMDAEQVAQVIETINNLKVFPTLHPAYIGRQWGMKPIWELDLKKISLESRHREIKLRNRKLYIDPPQSEAVELAMQLMESEEFAFDIETPSGELFCVGFSCSSDWALVLRTNESWKMGLIRMLLTSKVPKIAQNGLFDCSFLRKHHGIIVQNFTHDTMFAHAAAYTEYKKGLDFQVSMYLHGEPYYKEEGKHKGTGKKPKLKTAEDIQRYLEYNAKDDCYTYEIAQCQKKEELTDPNYRATFEYLMAQVPFVLDIVCNGIKCNKKALKAHATHYKEQQVKLQRELDEKVLKELGRRLQRSKGPQKLLITSFIQKVLAGEKTEKGGLNVNSSNDLQTFLYDILGMKEKKKRTKAGWVRTVEEKSLKELFGETKSVILLDIVTLKKLRKIRSSYLQKKFVAPDGRYYFSVNPVGTKTRRWSESKTIHDYGFNAQTLPGKIRDILATDSGYVMAFYDLEQAEDRIVAYLGNVTRKIWAYDNGVHPHKLTASGIFDISIDEIIKKDPDGKQNATYYLGKQSNLAFNYEMGPRTFYLHVNKKADETGIGITYAQAKKMREKHLTLYPELEMVYWAGIREQLLRNRTLINPFNDKRIFYGRMDKATFRDAYSWIPQSIPPRICNLAAIAIHRELPEVKILNQEHDALRLLVPVSEFEDLNEEIIKRMSIPIELNGHEIIIPPDLEGIGLNGRELKPPTEFFVEAA